MGDAEEIYQRAHDALEKNNPGVAYVDQSKVFGIEFYQGFIFGITIATVFWAAFALLLWLILR